MKAQDKNAGGMGPTLPPVRKKGISWIASVGAIVAVVLVISVSVLVIARLAHRRSDSTQGLPLGEWTLVLSGYTLTSLAAARSNPAVLYACVTQALAGTQVQGLPSREYGENNNPTYTILHSTDFGTHWQDVGAKAGFVGHCQLTINPADSTEIYVVSGPEHVSNGTPSADILKHSTDSGQTWKSIQPTLHVPSLHSPIAWQVQQISMVGNRLLGLQPIPDSIPHSQQRNVLQFVRLVTSTDGGFTWTVLDNQFQAAKLGVRGYASDPSNANTIYELVGRPLSGGPVSRSEPPSTPVPPYGTDGDLYRTTDGGVQWQLVLKRLPFGSEELASYKTQVIYAGGTASPLPLAGVLPRYPSSVTAYRPSGAGSFNLYVSSDGGVTWRETAPLLSISYVQNWFVGPDGRIYAYGGGFTSGTPDRQLTATATLVPQSTPRRGEAIPTRGSPTTQVPTMTPSPASHNTIESYDPTTDKWSELSEPPTQGALLAVTPARAGGGNILWFMASTGALYRNTL